MLLASCSGDSEKLSAQALAGTWALTDAEPQGHDKNGQGDELANLARMKRTMVDGQEISFFADSTFTELGGNRRYRYGRWRVNEEKAMVLLEYSDGSTKTLAANIEKGEKARLHLGTKSDRVIRHYVQVALPLEHMREDPFYPANNTWRIRPGSSETHQQLQARLGNYFRHLIYLLKAAKTRGQNIVSFEFSQGPVKIFDGGIGIHPAAILPERWIEAFHDKNDAMTTYRMYERYLQTSSYGNAGTGEWVVDDYNILLSIYGDLDAGKFPMPD